MRGVMTKIKLGIAPALILLLGQNLVAGVAKINADVPVIEDTNGKRYAIINNIDQTIQFSASFKDHGGTIDEVEWAFGSKATSISPASPTPSQPVNVDYEDITGKFDVTLSLLHTNTDSNDDPVDCTKITDGPTATVTVCPIFIKATSAGLSIGVSPKYNNSPAKGSIDHLIAVWEGEQLTLKVEVPEPLKSNMPSGFVTWTANGFSVPDNTTSYDFSWSGAGRKYVIINVGGLDYKIYIDIPDVGTMSEVDAALFIGVIDAATMLDCGVAATSAANQITSQNLPWRDAFRHSFWTSLSVSSGVSQSEVLFVTRAHEYDNKWVDHQQAFNSTMDLFNNSVGAAKNHTTPLGDPDTQYIVNLLALDYAQGKMYKWDGTGSQGASTGMVLKSNDTKIHP